MKEKIKSIQVSENTHNWLVTYKYVWKLSSLGEVIKILIKNLDKKTKKGGA